MTYPTNITPGQLRHAADLKEQIDTLQYELSELLGSSGQHEDGVAAGPKRRMSRAGRARIAAAARARWAKLRRQSGAGNSAPQKKRKMSSAAKARLSAIAKARWRKAYAQGKTRL